jgi:hypothetical protein
MRSVRTSGVAGWALPSKPLGVSSKDGLSPRFPRSARCFGFIEGGVQPAPQALLSVLTEVAILALVAVAIVDRARAHQTA